MWLDEFTTWIAASWPATKEFFNSVFFTAIAGSLAGALAGALGAQRIAERAKYREQLLKEMHDTNAAISVAFGICNSLLSIKKQHVKPLKDQLDGQRKELDEYNRKLGTGEIPKGTVFEFTVDLRTLSLPPLPIALLQSLVFDKVAVLGRPLSLTTTLGQSIDGMRDMFEKRNDLIASYKKAGVEVSPYLYFGLPQSAGHVNEDYPSSIRGIFSQMDDGIYFSNLLCKDLAEHGNALTATFSRQFGKGAPKIIEVEFGPAEKAGLMPDASDYADWASAFRKREPEAGGTTMTKRRLNGWQRLWLVAAVPWVVWAAMYVASSFPTQADQLRFSANAIERDIRFGKYKTPAEESKEERRLSERPL